MTSLFLLTEEYKQALDELTSSEDMPLEAIEDTLEALSLSLKDKVLNVAKYVKNLEVTSKAIREQEIIMAARRKSIDNNVSRLKEYMLNSMEHASFLNVESPSITVKVKRNPVSVNVIDIQKVPRYLIKQKVTETVDKAQAKKLLKDGEQMPEIPGLSLSQTNRVDIK